MGRMIPGAAVAQAAVVLAAAVAFAVLLAIICSSPTSEVAEHALNGRSAMVTPAPGQGLSATAISAPELSGNPDASADAALRPDIDDAGIAGLAMGREDMLSRPDNEVLILPAFLSGTGSQATQPFWLEPGTAVFDMRHGGSGDFEVWLMRNGSERYDLLLENGDVVDGSVLEQILEGGTYYLDVIADGEWQIDVSQLPG